MSANITTDAAGFASKTYDFVIIGAGMAGLALASRLSEDVSLSIGVLEAGRDESTNPHIASCNNFFTVLYTPQYHWGYQTVPQKNLITAATETEGTKAERALVVPRGKMLGGSSGVNGMCWLRASKPEYDALETFGNTGWNYESLVPYFKKTQAHTSRLSKKFPRAPSADQYQGSTGPVKTKTGTWYPEIASQMAESLSDLGFQANFDPENGNAVGVIDVVQSVDAETGDRQHSGNTYLKETAGRTNITVLLGAQATKIVLEAAKEGGLQVATAVEFTAGSQAYSVKATKEVILAAGTYNTPQLLELSGIGSPEILNKVGIPVKVDLPQVGENLMDHMAINGMFSVTEAGQAALNIHPDVLDPNHPSVSQGMVFLAANHQQLGDQDHLVKLLDDLLARKDLTPLEQTQLAIQREWVTNPSKNVVEAFVMHAIVPGTGLAWIPIMQTHPASRGSVHITSVDALTAPAIDPNFLAREYDVEALMHIVRFSNKMTQTGPLASVITGSLMPPADVIDDDEKLKGFIKASAGLLYHPVGTAAMASRKLGGVVDPKFVVYGTANLRVCDASVFPIQLGTMPMATVYAFAEKAADIIKTAVKT